MIIKFMEVEPYNNTGKDPNELRGFFKAIPRNDTFEFDGTTRPKCMLMNRIIYKEHVGINSADGVLLSIDLDTYFDKLDAGSSHESLLSSYGVGEIAIQFKSEDYPPKIHVQARAKSF